LPRVSPWPASKKILGGALLVVAAIGLGMLAAACGGSGPNDHYHPISTVAARPDIRVHKITGGPHSPKAEAALATEQTKNPGPAEELEPLHASQFAGPIAKYRAYSTHQAKQVQEGVVRLKAALEAGKVATAKRAELDAYDHYLRLGAAYGALSKLDEEIDGNAGRLPGSDHSPEFTGLHRIEMGLWEGEAPSKLIGPTDYLAAKVKRLRVAVRQIPISPFVYATRAHEILEDAQRDMLSDVDAPWSEVGLRATFDGLAATEFVIGTLRTVLDAHGEAVEPVEVELARFRQALERVRKEHGGTWPRLAAMTQVQHERVDGALGSLLEQLSAIPGQLEVKRTRPVPTIEEQEQERQ
jgi:iron uptake system EfeUOB component EfeO/EfeM